MKRIVFLCCCLGTSVFAEEPFFQPALQPAPAPIPQTELIIQQTGQLVITDRSPQEVIVIQRGCVWLTADGRSFIPIPIDDSQQEGESQ